MRVGAWRGPASLGNAMLAWLGRAGRGAARCGSARQAHLGCALHRTAKRVIAGPSGLGDAV